MCIEMQSIWQLHRMGVQRSAPKVLDKALTLLSEGSPRGDIFVERID